MSKDKIESVEAAVKQQPSVQSELDVVVNYLESFKSPLPLTISTKLRSYAYASIRIKDFLLKVLKDGMDDTVVRSYGSYWERGKYENEPHNCNNKILFGAISAMPVREREILFRNALTPQTALNTFFSSGKYAYLSVIKTRVDNTDFARNLLDRLSNDSLQTREIESLARNPNNKEILLNYIRCSPRDERNNYVREALSNNTQLHQFFAVQRGFFATSIKAGTLRELDRMNPDKRDEAQEPKRSWFGCF
ncbi:ankyrin repeat protein [Legionella geestiana]|uniref:Ankyrin repeat protein n=1 Tax=Legionella geestiana TaxID=45065 RepID=A0A0W0TZ42_9GAMM|nr:hypothetical protein [Legionella geestiana]KTD00685.1 ankyrin repeat protein [Legionella geestiana]QBS11702.1 hypothetical protein E4T54_02515 [Legionella geestiana]QDQ40686.1 hypothetical protein E3226_009905 [Legionella geestiana]STX53610.1 ankyrin repeat protein [Legionella geestiana]